MNISSCALLEVSIESVGMQGKDVGDAFVDAALAPIRQATGRLQNGAIADGLAGFGKTELLAGLRNGITRAAASLGCPTSDVEELLGWATFEPAMERLHEAHETATRTFREHASSVGGLLTGLSRNTAVEEYRQSGALCLRNMAQRFVRDKALCQPLEALADEIAAWEALVAKGGDKLEHSTLVTRSLKRRQMVRFVAAGLGLAVVIGGGVYTQSVKQAKDARQRVESAIINDNPCKVESIAATDLAFASENQLRRRDERTAACGLVRAREAHELACATLASNFGKGKLEAADMAKAKESATLLTRAIERKLTAEDLLVTKKDMPCQDTKAPEELFRGYVLHVRKSVGVWATALRLSDDLRADVDRSWLKGDVVAMDWLDELNRHAEELATKAILSGNPEAMQSAKASCEFRKTFQGELGKKCSGLMKLMTPKL